MRTIRCPVLSFRLLCPLCLCASVVSSGGCGSSSEVAAQAQSAKPSTPVAIKVVRPTREHLKRGSTPQPAHVAPYEKTDIHAKVSGYVETIGPALGLDGKPIPEKDGSARPLDIGDPVNKGQVLAELSIPELKQELVRKAALVEKAQADLGQAGAATEAAKALLTATRAKAAEAASMVAKYEADVTYQVKEHARYLRLSRDQVLQAELADQELTKLRAAEAHLAAAKNAVATTKANIQVDEARVIQAKADERAAQARLKVAEADRKYAEIIVDYATIRAPYRGIITRRLVDTGTFVQSAASGKAEPLFTVARVDRLRIIADIPEAEAGLVKIGQSASFQLTASRGQPLAGKIVRFADALDSGSRTMRVEVELDGPPANLRPGMFGSITITFIDVPDALTLPTSALLAGARPSVLAVEAGHAKRRAIEIGHSDGVRTQITGGLDTNAHVIADGKTTIREGDAVELPR